MLYNQLKLTFVILNNPNQTPPKRKLCVSGSLTLCDLRTAKCEGRSRTANSDQRPALHRPSPSLSPFDIRHRHKASSPFSVHTGYGNNSSAPANSGRIQSKARNALCTRLIHRLG